MGVRLPFELGIDGESIVLAAANRIAQGLSPYPPITQQLPYIINLYGPVPYYLGAVCIKSFGVSFTAPRILVAVSAGWCAVIIALLVHHWGGSPRVSAVFGALYVAMGPTQEWLVYYRVDLIGIAFALTGLYIYAKSRRQYFSVLFFATALFCKFTLLSAPFACFADALCRREWRKAFGFAACSLALGSLLFLWMQQETQGWFGVHTILANTRCPYSLSAALKSIYKDQLNPACCLVVLGVALVYYALSCPDLRLPVIYLGGAFLSLLAAGKAGAADNYFLESYAALCLCGGIAYQLLRKQADFQSMISALLPATLALYVMLNLHSARQPAPYSECRQAYDYVKAESATDVLSDNLGAVLMAGKPILINGPFLWSSQIANGGWPETDSNLVELIRSHQLGLILLSSRIDGAVEPWPEPVLDATRENYVLTKTFTCPGAEFVYRPRP